MLLIVIGAAAYAMTLIQQSDRFPLTLGIVLCVTGSPSLAHALRHFLSLVALIASDLCVFLAHLSFSVRSVCALTPSCRRRPTRIATLCSCFARRCTSRWRCVSFPRSRQRFIHFLPHYSICDNHPLSFLSDACHAVTLCCRPIRPSTAPSCRPPRQCAPPPSPPFRESRSNACAQQFLTNHRRNRKQTSAKTKIPSRMRAMTSLATMTTMMHRPTRRKRRDPRMHLTRVMETTQKAIVRLQAYRSPRQSKRCRHSQNRKRTRPLSTHRARSRPTSLSLSPLRALIQKGNRVPRNQTRQRRTCRNRCAPRHRPCR